MLHRGVLVKNFFVYFVAVLLGASTAHAVTTVTISWQDNASNEDGFTIERATSAAGPFTGVGTVGANVTSYVDTDLPEAATVCYRMNAFNIAGASPYTGVICGITKATLNLTKAGTGNGQVTSSPAGINCTVSCVVQLSGNSIVTLTATAAAGSVFTGWSGNCTGTGSCAVTMNSEMNVTANFNLNGANRGTDYDGDGKTDIAVYRGGNWYIVRSSDGAQTLVQWGGAQDIPVAADYDGDGRSDIAIYRDGTWFIERSSDGAQLSVQWGGTAQDIPVPADYDGDVKADIAVYRNGIWYILRSSDGGITEVQFGGLARDVPVPGDYDGDGKTDIAVYRDGEWNILRSSNGEISAVSFGGLAQDVPVPQDYDGDGKTDMAVYRDGIWFTLRSSDGGIAAMAWGGALQDIPLK